MPKRTTPPLPSLDDCIAALSPSLDPTASGTPCSGAGGGGLGKWRRLIQRCLSYGTDYDRRHLRDNSQGGVEKLKRRAEEAGGLLADALSWNLSRQLRMATKKAATDDGDGPQNSNRPEDDPATCAVVEALWLAGCLLDSSDEAATSDDIKEVGDRDIVAPRKPGGVPSRECLPIIVRRLVAPVPWTIDAFDDRDHGNNKSKKIVNAEGNREGMEVDGVAGNKYLPLVPVTLLQATLELPLLEAADLLPHPPLSMKPKKTSPPKKGAKGGVAGKGAKPAVAPDSDMPSSLVQKKLKKLNTDMYYRQHKFNLLAEESEGYAKLLSFFVAGLGGGDWSSDWRRGQGGGSHEDGKEKRWESLPFAQADNGYVRELVGAFHLDPNRVLDLALDALEWELNELVTRSAKEAATAATSKSASFAELSRLGNDDGTWWGLERVRSAMASLRKGSSKNNARAIHSLLAIVRELDGNAINAGGGYAGRGAVAHLLGFKYRYCHGRMVAKTDAKRLADAKQHQKSNATALSDGKPPASPSNAAAAAAVRNVYPRSLHLSAAFLCAHGMLDPHDLLPHLVANKNESDLSPSFKAMVTTKATSLMATDLMQAYKAHSASTIRRLKRLGVVSLNSANKSSQRKDERGQGDEGLLSRDDGDDDPVIGVFRALLALMPADWDAAAAFLAHGAAEDFACLVKQGRDNVNGVDDELRSAMDSAALAACTLHEDVASDVCAWVNGVINQVCPPAVNGNDGRSGGDLKRPLVLLTPSSSTNDDSEILTENSSLAKISLVLGVPLSCIARSGRIRHDQGLYVRLCRLYKNKLGGLSSETDDQSPEATVDEITFSVLSTFLVPSLSLFPPDTTLPAEVWSVLKLLPYRVRYRLYSAWRYPGLEKGSLRAPPPSAAKFGVVSSKPLDAIESEIKTGIAARYVLKRISKENICEMGRQLATTSHNNPLVVFTDILGKIESYDNMISMVVDTFTYVTELGLDVMGYCLLVSLGGGGDDVGGARSRTKMGGLNTEQWLASLETFTGEFYKKFPDVELRGILVYLTRRLQNGHASELGVLRSLIKTAGGYGYADYDSTAALSDLQLDGLRGSRLLKRETSSFGVVGNINRRSSRRLRSVLQGEDLGVIILILLSQIRSRVLYTRLSDMAREHVKVIGSMYDDCEAVLCLLLEYLSDSSDDPNAKEKFAASMPSLWDLHGKYGVDTAVAWMLCRPLVRKSMFYIDDGKPLVTVPPAYLKPFVTCSLQMSRWYQGLLPEAVRKNITPTMFETFYSYAIYDISCPEERYNVDIDRLKKECERLTQLQRGGEAARGQMSALAAAAAAAGGSYDQIRRATAFTETHAMELDRLKRNVDQLSKDFQHQQKRCELVLSKLEAQKKSLIRSDKEGEEQAINNSMFAPTIMTFCIYPRCFLSPEDSLFCAHFVKLLHRIQVPGFLTIELIDNMVNAVTGSLYCMTENEAGNCAIFFNEIWKCANSWRYDNDAFASKLKDTPGSQLSKEFAHDHGIGNHSLTGGITHDDYKTIYRQWHQKIGSTAIGCLESHEYMHTRAALIVLSRIVLVFPTQPKTGDEILKTLDPLQGDDNERPDLRATAQGYCSQLIKARDDGMWKEENIAVTKARQEKEKMKAEERKKKLAKQHEDIKKESEMISRQLGDGRDGWRPDRRDDRRDDRGRPWGMDRMDRMDPRMHSRGPPLNANAPTFTPKSGESRELHVRTADSRRPGMDRDVWERDRGGGRQPDGRDGWRQGAESGRGERRKRSRSPEPGEDTERQKRSRGGERDWRPHSRDQSGSDQHQSSRGGVRRGIGSIRY